MCMSSQRKELAITRLEHRSEMHSNESQHLAGGTEVARLWRRFSFALHKTFSFRMHHHLCRQGVALVGAPDSSVRKARCRYTRLISRGQPGPRDRKE